MDIGRLDAGCAGARKSLGVAREDGLAGLMSGDAIRSLRAEPGLPVTVGGKSRRFSERRLAIPPGRRGERRTRAEGETWT